MKPIIPSTLIRDFRMTVGNMQPAYDFTMKHRVWEGVMNYRWLSKLLIVIGVILGLSIFNTILNWWNGEYDEQLSAMSVGGVISNVFKGGYDLFVLGGLKYVVLILAEVVIFHFVRKTLEIISGEEVDSSFKAFVLAQKRMFSVAFYSFFMESIISVIFSWGIKILDLEIVEPAGVFLIQCFFLGFAIIDNYNEIFHMTVKQSFKYTQQYMGVALAIGIPVYLVMMLPLLGTIVGPIIGAVVATITMNELLQKDRDMAWVFIEKEKKEK